MTQNNKGKMKGKDEEDDIIIDLWPPQREGSRWLEAEINHPALDDFLVFPFSLFCICGIFGLFLFVCLFEYISDSLNIYFLLFYF